MREDSSKPLRHLLRPEVHWSRAMGYVKMGMFKQARTELSGLPDELPWSKQKKSMLLEIFQEVKNWKEMQKIAYELRMEFPHESGWWVSDAYATRRSLSIEQARDILLEALVHNYDDALIRYNLACYACQLGSPGECLDFLKEAVKRDERYKAMALADEDLKGVQAALREMGWSE